MHLSIYFNFFKKTVFKSYLIVLYVKVLLKHILIFIS